MSNDDTTNKLLAFMKANADERVQYAHRLAIIKEKLHLHQSYDVTASHVPSHIQLKVRTMLAEMEAEEQRQLEAQHKADERRKQHEDWLERQQTAEQLEAQRIRDNRKVHGDLRPESIEVYRALSPQLKVKLIEMFGSDFPLQLVEKPVGMSWAQYDRLRGIATPPQPTPADGAQKADEPPVLPPTRERYWALPLEERLRVVDFHGIDAILGLPTAAQLAAKAEEAAKKDAEAKPADADKVANENKGEQSSEEKSAA